MNKTFLFIMAALCCALFSSCGDDGEDSAQEVSHQTGLYSNYSHENNSSNLSLTYNNEEVIDKELEFYKPLYSDTCEMTLKNVLSKSNVVFNNVVLTGGPDGEIFQQYSFLVDTVIDNKMIHCEGEISSPGGYDIVGAKGYKAFAYMTMKVTETNAE